VESNLESYLLLARDVPPDNDYLVKYGGWWGCGYFLVRDEAPPNRAVETDLSGLFSAAELALERGSKPAEIGKARLMEESEKVAFLVGAAPGLGADPRFLLYAEAVAEVEEWFYLHDPGHAPPGHWLEGRRNRIRVALVPPFRVSGGPLSVPDEQREAA